MNIPKQGAEPHEPLRPLRARSFALAAAALLLIDFLFILPQIEYIDRGGTQGMVYGIFICGAALIVDLILLAPAYFFMKSILSGRHLRLLICIGGIALAAALGWSIWQTAKPLPQTQEMIGMIPQAEAHFRDHRESLQAQADAGETVIPYFTYGPHMDMHYLYAPDVAYPKTGQLSRIHYVYPLGEGWYIEIMQHGAI